ncbi:MAG: FHA domain-containing protein [Candidatus Riflebacteria bacterium]|nr:FHA domain-containing protein [Candidatus Riflebacteria bacterium]
MTEDSKKTVFRRAVGPQQEEIKKKYLVGNTPPYLGKPYELNKDSTTIGRVEERDLFIASDMISRQHATIVRKDEEFSIQDNGSSNGTFLNNTQIEPNKEYKLQHRDIIKFDAYEFIFIDSTRADLWETLKPLSREGARIITVYSPKGGTGLTSIAVNLASALSAGGKKKVAVADFNFSFGDVLTFSSGKPGPCIADLLRETEITSETIEKYILKGPGYSILAAPNKPEEAELANDWALKTPDKLQKILWSLEAKHDFVIVDLKNQMDDITITTWEISNMILLVGRPEIGHLFALKKVIGIMDKLKYPESKVKLLINTADREGAPSKDDIKAILKRDFIQLPNSPTDAIRTSQGGKAYYVDVPDCPLSKAIGNLARNIRGEEIAIEGHAGIFGKLKSLLGF